MRIIWQTQPGQQTEFEKEFLLDVVFAKMPCTAIFDNASYCADGADATIVYSTFREKAAPELLDYLARSEGHSLVHLSEEQLHHENSYYKNARVVLRSYYDPRITAANVFTLPLGFQSGFLNKRDEIDFSMKELVWCFAGQIKSNRKKMVKELSRFEPHKIVLTSQWADPNGLSVEEMAQTYKRSIFAPCPFGNRNPDSFRLMESLEHGCIPVVLYFLDHDPFRYVMGDHPFIIDRTWARAAKQMEALLNDPARLRKKQDEVARWYKAYKGKLSADIAKIFSGAKHEDLSSEQFQLQRNGVSERTLFLYNLYYGRGLIRRAFRALVHAYA